MRPWQKNSGHGQPVGTVITAKWATTSFERMDLDVFRGVRQTSGRPTWRTCFLTAAGRIRVGFVATGRGGPGVDDGMFHCRVADLEIL